MKTIKIIAIALVSICSFSLHAQNEYVELPIKDSCVLYIGETPVTDTMNIVAMLSAGKLHCKCTTPEFTGDIVDFDVIECAITAVSIAKDASNQIILRNEITNHTQISLKSVNLEPNDLVQFGDLVIVYKEALFTTIPFVTVIATH